MATPRRSRIWSILRVVLTIIGISALLMYTFGALPPREPFANDAGLVFGAVLADILIFSLLIGFIVVWQRRRIRRTHRTTGALVEAISLIFLLFIGVTARLYHVMSVWYPDAFNRPLDFIDSIYLSMMIFSTVGFGDIYPTNHLTQGIVMIQMILDLVFLGVVVRVLVEAARAESPQAPEQSP